MTPTQRTLKYLRDEGYHVGIVERWIQRMQKRIDLFGIIDLIAMDGEKIVGVQSCGQSFSEHDKKIMASPETVLWLQSQGRLMLIGWRKVKKKRGGKQMVWKPRVKIYRAELFEGLEL